MQKITEIKENFTVGRESGAAGAPHENTQTHTRYRHVNFVEGSARFGHYLIDRVCLFLLYTICGAFFGSIIGLTGSYYLLRTEHFNIYNAVFNWLVLRTLYYFVFEFAMQATPGKAILKRVVIDEYGNKPTAKQILIRSISRAVPLEPFSCFDTFGWHDRWSKTFVIRSKDLEELMFLQKINQLDPITPIPGT